GCTWVIVGHSERRTIHGEDDALVNRKVRAALRHGLTPILCLGEGEDVREAGDHVRYCTAQLDAALDGLGAEDVEEIVIAYARAAGSGSASLAHGAWSPQAPIPPGGAVSARPAPDGVVHPEVTETEMRLFLDILLIASSVLLVLLVLLHRGRGGGLSSLFGGGMQSSLAGSSVVEKHLDRLPPFA